MIGKCDLCGATGECRPFIADGWYTGKVLCESCRPCDKQKATELRLAFGIGFHFTEEDKESFDEWVNRKGKEQE